MLQKSVRLLAGILQRQGATIISGSSPTAAAVHGNSRGVATNEAQQLQEAALEENCILVDENDRSLGYGSKRDCHRVSADGQIKLHRAFSVFLFNTDGDMLLQKRSSHKVRLFLECFVHNDICTAFVCTHK